MNKPSHTADAGQPGTRERADPVRRKASTAEAFQRAALAVSSVGGPHVFDELVRSLASILATDVAFVAVFRDDDPSRMRTLAAWLDGKLLRNFDYVLAGSPCARVVGHEFRYMPSGVHPEFRPDTIFAAKGMDSYAAYPLNDAAGEPLGLLVTMKRTPIANPDLAEAVLKIFAVRIAAEIERARTEDALRRAALAVSSAKGDAVFRELVRDLASILGVDMAFIAQPKEGAPGLMQTLAVWLDGHTHREVEYTLAGTPCETIVGQQYRAYPSRLRERFPGDADFAALAFESYAGFPLMDTRGVALGLISVVSRRPLLHPALVESILKIFAVRAAAEVERQRADEAVRVSEASYRSIFEAAEDPVFVHDWETGAIVDVNPAACGVYGYSHDEMLHVTLDDISSGRPPYTAAEGLRRIEEAKENGSVQFEWHRRNRDGSLRWDEVRLKRAMIGGKRRVLAFTRDITERKFAEERLRASEEQYRAIFNASEDALILWDSALKRVDVNPAYERVFGWAREEVIGRSYEGTWFSPEYAEPRLDLVRRTLAGEPCYAELESVRKNGERFHAEVRTIPIQHRGEPHVLAIARDVTERKRAEAAILASEEQYRAIFDASADGIVLRDADFRIVDINAAALAMVGRTRKDVLGLDRLVVLAEAEQERIRAMHRRVLSGESIRYETQGLGAHGRKMELEIRLVPMQHQGRPHVLAIARDLTDLRAATEALRTSEEQYRAVFNASIDGMSIRALDGRLVDVNPAFLRMYGYAREELVGQNPSPIIGPERMEQFRLILSEVAAGRTFRVETPIQRKDGSWIHIEVHASPLTYHGEPHLLAVVRDVTQRKADENRLRATVEAALDAIVVMDTEDRIVEFNPAAEACFGHRRTDVLGKRLADLLIPERFREAHLRGMARYLATGQGANLGRRVEVNAMRADGTEFPAELAIAVTDGPAGKLFVGYLRDITEQKRAEEALRVSSEQYRAIFNAAVDALVLRDADFRIVDVNPAYEAMSGYSLAQVAGADYVVANPSAINEEVKALHRRALAGEPIQLETQIVPREGGPLEVELRGLPIRHQGRPHVLYVGRDITARKRADAERVALEAQLRQAQKMEAIGHLTGGIAHDFNNILTSVMGYVGLAAERDSASGDAKLGGYLEQALRSCRRARDLIQQMLVFSRGQRGERRPTDLAPIVEESTRLLRSMLPATLQLQTELDAPVPQVDADRVQAEQVLLNLAINARDAMNGRGTLTIGLHRHDLAGAVCASCRKPVSGRFVVLTVGDTGPGIPAEVMDRMFEPFYSTKEVGKGSGMGLATVHGIVHDHGGHILVESAPGRGTTFRALLPMLDGVRKGNEPAAEPSDSPPRRPRLEGRVLVVDDEASVAAFMQELLESWGLVVTATGNPLDALDRVGREPSSFDLVITDLTMPGITGLQLARDIAVINPALPIVLSTGYSEGVTDSALRGANIRALLRKPIETGQLREILESELVRGATTPS